MIVSSVRYSSGVVVVLVAGVLKRSEKVASTSYLKHPSPPGACARGAGRARAGRRLTARSRRPRGVAGPAGAPCAGERATGSGTAEPEGAGEVAWCLVQVTGQLVVVRGGDWCVGGPAGGGPSDPAAVGVACFTVHIVSTLRLYFSLYFTALAFT